MAQSLERYVSIMLGEKSTTTSPLMNKFRRVGKEFDARGDLVLVDQKLNLLELHEAWKL